jgi:murein L,D-transpeptidase YcbB/YkuD
VAGASIASTVVLPAMYERRAFRPIWGDPAAVGDLLAAIRASGESGLDPTDYHLAALERLGGERRAESAEATADFDLLATDALVRLAYHLRFGKVDPARLDPNWNFTPALPSGDPAAALQDAIDAGRVRAFVYGLEPTQPFYVSLKRALAAHRSVAEQGGWPVVPAGPPLTEGTEDARVTALRQRLRASGDLRDASDAPWFDAAVTVAVQQFQTRHGLTADGVVGPATLRALDVPVAARIEQIRATLERSRWVMHDLPPRFVLVNVAGFMVYLVDGGAIVWESPVVVGTTYTRTPIFRADMTYVVLNPTWTVPASIVRKEILPGLRRDPKYLARKGLTRVGNQYVQPPGPRNALGRIKLMLPNPHSVYLHDTPSKSFFAETSRTFSHGCVRVEKPVELAARSLDDPAWNEAALERAIGTGRTQTVLLQRPLPVLILYWTAAVGRDGLTYFLPDVYGRDPAIIAGLGGDFTVAARLRAAP